MAYELFAFPTQPSCFVFSPIGSAGSPPGWGIPALGPLCQLSTASAEAQEERGAVAEQQFEYSYLTLQTTEDTLRPRVRQNDIKLSVILDLCLAVLQKWAVHSKRGTLIDRLPSGALK